MQLKATLFFLITFFTGTYAGAQVPEQEALIKAAFVYNFTKYVEWDEKDKQPSFIVGIIGNASIITPLTKIAVSNTVDGKKIVLKYFSSPDAIEYCNILYIPEKVPFPLYTILEKTGKGTLTISEEPGFANLGTAFNFVVKNDKLKFEANLKAIYAANLKVSSQLLKLAIIID